MIRIESIKALYKFFYGKFPSVGELEKYTIYPDYLKLELINSLIIMDSGYSPQLLSTTQIVRDFFKSLFNYSDEEMNTIIQEQEAIALNGGIDGFAYWVNELENNSKVINVNTLAIALLNGAAQKEQQRVIDSLNSSNLQINEIIDYYSNINLQYSQIANVNTYGVDSLLYGVYWNNRDILTYSFNESISSYYYEFGNELISGFTLLNNEQKNAVRDILDKISLYVGLDFKEIDSTAQIKFSMVDMADNLAGFSFYPTESNEIGGDVFLSNIYNDFENAFDYSLEENSFSWSTIAHEIGHALGLKHPFEGGELLPENLDNITYTIMSYSDKFNYIPQWEFINNSFLTNYKTIFPNLLSIFDLSALHAIYGENTQTNNTDTIYTFNFYDYTFETIWDTGGIDTIDLSNTYGSTYFDMKDGSVNSVDVKTLNELKLLYTQGINDIYFKIEFENDIITKYQNNLLYTGKNNVSIAIGTIIENINTGFGRDVIKDNEYNNVINTNASNDNIYLGNGGYDIIDGGSGIDKVYLDLEKSDVNIEELENSYLLTTDSFAAELKNIELIYFSNNSFYSIENLLI